MPKDSKLETIGECAFFGTNIECFTIPSHLTFIDKKSFKNCKHLNTFEIPMNSKLKTIERDAFNKTSIESLTIPHSLIELKEGFCVLTKNLISIKVCQNNPRYSVYEDKLIIGKSVRTK